MCLIIQGPASTLRRVVFETPHLLESVLNANANGVGAMWPGEGNVPMAAKLLSDDEAAVRAWLAKTLPEDDRPAAVHARFATSGDKNSMGNCHPYEIDGCWLMHNGVLDIDTKSAPERSDTWHYCHRFLQGTLRSLVATEQGEALLADHIGAGNRFVVLDREGRMHIINRATGVEYAGLWFANTYAWDPSTLDPAWVKPRAVWYDSSAWKGHMDWYDTYGGTACAGSMLDDDECAVDNYRDDNGSLAYLLYENEEWLESALEDAGVQPLLQALVAELGAPELDQAVADDIDAGRDSPFNDLCALVVDGSPAAVAAAASREGGTALLAEVLVYGLAWGETATTTEMLAAA